MIEHFYTDKRFEDNWLWVGPGSEQRILTALDSVLTQR